MLTMLKLYKRPESKFLNSNKTRERQTDRHKDRQTDRQRQRQTDIQRERQAEKEREYVCVSVC